MRKYFYIFFTIVFLTSLGYNSYAQDLPVACGGSTERYGVVGYNGSSTFEWTVTGAENVVVYGLGDSIDVQWNNVAGAHFFTVIERAINGCEGEPYQDTVIITTPFIDIGLDGEICEGGTYEFIASRDDISTYLWQDSSDVETFIASESGKYWVRVTDTSGCVASDTASLIVYDLPAVDLGSDTTYCGIEGLVFDVSDYGTYYDWFNGDISPTFTAYTQTQDQEIWVNVTDDNGCVGSDTIIVRSCGELEIPTAFTPNDDGHNDIWQIDALIIFPDCTVDVYNRWGDRVFHSDGYSSEKSWDGNSNKGKKLPMDAYYYVIDLHNGEEPMVGTVTIIR